MQAYLKNILFITCCIFFLSHQTIEAFTRPVRAELIAEQSTVAPGQPFWLALRLEIVDEWHVYWKNPGDAGFPPTVEWELPPGFTVGPLLWPTPERFKTDGFTGYGYHHEVTLLTQITPPENLEMGQKVELKGHVEWVACKNNCLPGFETLELELPVTQKPTLAALEALHVLKVAKQNLPRVTWNISARHGQSDHIEVDIMAHPDNRLLSASFLPDEAGLINDGAEQTLAMREEAPGHYVLTLKRSEESTAGELSALRGLLVLQESLMHDENMQVLAINLPLNSELFNRPNFSANKETQSASQAAASRSKDPCKDEEKPNPLVDASIGATETIDPLMLPPAQGDASMPLGLALFFAALGGLILNLMPCVLPVISLKLFHFIKIAEEKRSEILAHGASFCAGVLISFWALAAVLLGLKAYGHAVGWGFQLQDPRFVAFMIIVLFILTLSLWGVFELGVGVASQAGKFEGKAKGKLGSFMSGVLATFVATPCTGPFMGPVLGFAMGASAFQAFLIFTFMGIGMSLPYFLCSAFPQLIRFLPKPGAWMNTFKQIMGFFMAGSVLWLVWVFGAQTDNNALLQLFVGLLCFAVACWIYGSWALTVRRGFKKNLVYGSIFFFCALGAVSSHLAAHSPFSASSQSEQYSQEALTDPNDPKHWQPFSQKRMNELAAEGTPVFIDFTAKWCITCQANKPLLHSEEMEAAFKKRGVVKIKADWTRRDPEITAALQGLGRAGVPVYALYGPDHSKKPQVLTSFPLTEAEVLKALEELDKELDN